MQKITELKIILVATMGLLCLATAEGIVTKQGISSRLNDLSKGYDEQFSGIQMLWKQRNWVLKQAQLLGKQRDIEVNSATAAIDLLNNIPVEAKTAGVIRPQYESAKVAINNNRSLLAQTDKELAELEKHRPN